MEPKSLVEVVIYGPASAGEATLRRAVLRKLDYVLARQSSRPGR
jgi:GTP-binding protein EngB required for normal cell division